MDEKPRRINWHRVLFTAGALVALELIVLVANSRDGRIPTILGRDGRNEIRRYYRNNYPQMLKSYPNLLRYEASHAPKPGR